MAFDPTSLLSDERLEDGPLVVYWNQEREEFPREPVPEVEERPLRWLWRLLGVRRWRFAIRLTPPPGEPLAGWGQLVADQLSMTWRAPLDSDRAVWIYGGVFARNASNALGSMQKVL